MSHKNPFLLSYPTPLNWSCIMLYSQEFSAMNEDELKDCLQEARILNVTTDDLFTSIFSWINFDTSIRKCTLDKTMHLIDIQSCSKNVLQQYVDQQNDIVEENPEFNSAVLNILNVIGSPVPIGSIGSPVPIVPSHVVVADTLHDRQCWKLDIGESYQFKEFNIEEPCPFTEFTRIPDCLFNEGIGLCVYEGVGLILTGGLMDLCAVYEVATNKWHTMEQKWIGRYRHASVCIQVSASLF